MARIWTGDVWVRSTVRPRSAPAWSTNRVSKSLRAGWSSPMLRAPKLYQSVSTSGPSATWKPRPMNTSSSRSHAWVTRWAWPRRGLPANSDRSSRSASTRRAISAPVSASRRPAIAAATASTASFRRCPVVRRSSTVASPPRRVLSWARSPRLPSSWESRATISSTVLAAAIFSRAASRAAAMSSITGSPFLNAAGEAAGAAAVPNRVLGSELRDPVPLLASPLARTPGDSGSGTHDDRQGRPRVHPGHRNRRVSTAERIDGASNL